MSRTVRMVVPVIKESIPAQRDHKPRGEVRRSGATRWRIFVLILVHLIVAAHVMHWWMTGESISAMEPSEAYETIAYGTVNAGFILLVLLILSTLVVGRFFCGWACHVVAYQDLCAGLLGRFGLRPKPVRSRLLAFVPALAAVDIFVLPALQRWLGDGGPSWSLTWQTTTDSLWSTFPGWGMALATIAVDGFLVVWFFGSKGFCSYGCPYGALFGLADKVAPGRIRVTDACEGCGHCTAVCTSNVQVHSEVAKYGMVIDSGCMRCMDCVSVCPKDALHFGFGASVEKEAPPKAKRTQRIYDFSWGEELAMAAVFACAVFGFRNLYGAIPFLMSVGMATIASLAAVLTWRLIRGAALTFQHTQLRDANGLTRPGMAALALAPLYLGLVAHSDFIQYHQRQGVAWNTKVAGLVPGSEESQQATNMAIEHLEHVAGWALVDTAELHNRLGQLYAHDRASGEAIEHLKAAIEIDPDNVSALVALGEVLMLENRNQEAMDSLLTALAIRPGGTRGANGLLSLMLRDEAIRAAATPRLKGLVETFTAASPERIESQLRLAEAYVASMQLDLALPLLDTVLSAHADHPVGLRTLSIILQRNPSHRAANELAARIQQQLSAP